MTEQERNVLLNELRQQESQREKQIKRERFRRLNPYAKKGAVVFAGSSLMEQFPLYEFLQDDDLHCTLYNRGIGGFTTTELLEAMDECILELQPAHLFLNIGTNDLNGPDYDRAAMLGRYEGIVQQIRKKLPETKLYLLAYYPVNPTVAEDPGLIECFRWRTNERIREASEGVQALARKYGAEFLDLNKDLYDTAGNLKAEYTIEGMHLYANGYRPVMDALLPLLLYCVLPCVVLKSFCIEYSEKGAVELAVSIAAGAGVLLLSMAVSWLFFRKAPWRQIGTVLIIVNAAPIGSNIVVYAQRLGLDSSYAVQMVCLSTLLSLITLPVMLSLAAALGFA